jgi:sugar lactone lactonase YvrE
VNGPLSRPALAAVAALTLSGAFAGCSGSNTAGSNLPTLGSSQALRAVAASAKKKVNQTLFVADRGDAAILGWPSTTTGNVAPTVNISGSNTGLTNPVGFTVDGQGNLYAVNDSDHQIEIFPAGSNGNVTPQILGGSNVPISGSEGVAVDSSGQIYFSDYENPKILVFAAGSTGNATPIRTIAGSNTGLTEPVGMAFDSQNHLYVANYSGSGVAIVEFDANANGNVAPIGTIGEANGGGKTTLYEAFNMAINDKDEIVVANESTGAIDIFKSANGNHKPSKVIQGSNTGITDPTSIGIDAKGYMYVTNFAGSGAEILVFSPSAKGNVAPVRVISGSSTTITDSFYPSFH